MLLLDIDMPEMSGLDVARVRQRCRNSFEIISLTMHREEDLFNEAMNIGVNGYVPKDPAAADILPRCVSWPGGGRTSVRRCPSSSSTAKEIAEKLRLSPRTVALEHNGDVYSCVAFSGAAGVGIATFASD